MWGENDANHAGLALSRVSDATLEIMHAEMMRKDILKVEGNLPDEGACCICNLSGGDRPRKCVPQNRFEAELQHWTAIAPVERIRERDAVQSHAEVTRNYWSALIGAQRANHSILCYPAWKQHGHPPPGTNASHLCGSPKCVNPSHIVWESMQYNATRNYCSFMSKTNPKFDVATHCLHNPPCIVRH